MHFSEWPTLVATLPHNWPDQLTRELPALRQTVEGLPPGWDEIIKQVGAGCVREKVGYRGLQRAWAHRGCVLGPG